MWGRKAPAPQEDQMLAQRAIDQSQGQYDAIKALTPEVEATVQSHRKLQGENHFAERIWLAYRGELS